MVKRGRDVRDLEELGEVLQPSQYQSDGEDGAELRLAGLFEAFDNVYPLLMVPQDVMRSCAARVRELRIRQNITQKELAERVGVAEGTIKRFEKTGEADRKSVV